MSMPTARANVLAAMKELSVRWEKIKEQWDDPVSQDIEEKFIAPLEPRVRAAAASMNTMGEYLTRAMHECS